LSRDYVNRSHDEEIIDTLKGILEDGDMVVETFNESVLCALMERRKTPIRYSKSLRDIEADYRQWKKG